MIRLRMSVKADVFRIVFNEAELPLFTEVAKYYQLYKHEDDYYFEFKRQNFDQAIELIQAMEFQPESLPAVLNMVDRLNNPRPTLTVVRNSP